MYAYIIFAIVMYVAIRIWDFAPTNDEPLKYDKKIFGKSLDKVLKLQEVLQVT